MIDNLMALVAELEKKRETAKNLYMSGIAEEFIALQLDLEIPAVIDILKSYGIYKGTGSKNGL